MPTSWKPILEPTHDLTPLAWESIYAIANSIKNRDYPEAATNLRSHRPQDEPLLYGYLALSTDDDEWLEATTTHLNDATENASQSVNYRGLYGGLSGLGWIVENLSSVLQEEDDEEGETSAEEDDLNAETDAALISELQQPHPWGNKPYDLISGLVGYGVYFLERLPSPAAERGLSLILDRLEELSTRVALGITWHSSPELLPEWQREQCPGGYYNLGVAHGIPGILHLLSETHAAGIEKLRTASLLNDAMAWFLAQKRPEGSRSWFSSWVPTPGEARDSRLTWCYGDLGILSVLQQIAIRSQRSDWREFADRLRDHCVAWPTAQSGVADAPLCHGAAGNAHIFNRVYQQTGDERCREVALQYLNMALSMRAKEGGVAGYFQVTRPDPAGPQVLEPSPAFLDGANGLALALLAATTNIEPQWDRMLLLSSAVA